MVHLRPNSDKLIDRGKGIVMMLTGNNYDDASALYEAAGRNIKTAVVMGRLGIDRSAAESRLDEADGFVARALGER